MHVLLHLNKYFLKYKWLFLSGIACTALSDFFSVLSPQATGFILDLITQQKAPTSTHYTSFIVVWLQRLFADIPLSQQVISISFIILGLALCRGIFMYVMRQTLVVGSRKIEYDLKNEIYQKYQSLDSSFFDKNHTGDLMNRITEDVSKVRMYVGPALMYMANIGILFSMSLYFMLRTSPLLTSICILPFPLLIYLITRLHQHITRTATIVQKELSNLTTLSNESFNGISIIQSFSQEKHYEQLFNLRITRHKNASIQLNKMEAFYFNIMYGLIHLSTLIAICVGGYLALYNQIPLSVVVSFVLYINLLTVPFSLIGYISSMLQKATVSQKRIDAFLLEKPHIKDPNRPLICSNTIQGALRLDNITFSYNADKSPIFNNFSLHIHAYEKIAIMGSVGSGKTTLAKLLLRLYDPQKGTIFIDDIALPKLSLTDLRKQFAYAPQDISLFSETILSNFHLGKNTISQPDTATLNAAQDACILTDILGKEKGWHAQLGEKGVSMSGGQKQRLSLARALIDPCPILLLDDTLSAVDFETEKNILSALKKRLVKQTFIHITHRINTEISYDRIIVLANGKIIQEGTHQTLSQQDGWYKETLVRQTAYKEIK